MSPLNGTDLDRREPRPDRQGSRMKPRSTTVLSIIVIALMIAVGIQVEIATAASQGGRCSKAGITQKTKGVVFTCTRVGKSLKWARKYSPKDPTPTSVMLSGADLLRLNPVSPEPLNNCRLPDLRASKFAGEWQAITYPAVPNNGFTNSGVVDIAVVFVDFPDVVGGSAELADGRIEIMQAADWYSWFSQGNVKYNLRIADRWVRAPKNSEYFFWLHPGKAGTQLLPEVDIANIYRSLAGSVVDTRGIVSVWVVIPKAVTAIDEGFAYRAFPGVFSLGSDTFKAQTPIWQHFVHETLHSHGALGHSPKNASIGLFWTTGSAAATINSWDAMTLGWMNQENLFCVSKENLKVQALTLVPVEREQAGLRAVIVKLSASEALIIESHRKDKWSKRWPNGISGVSVMRVDTRLDTVWDEGPATGKYLIPSAPHSLEFMREGQSFTVDGVKITVVQATENDQIRIEPAS